MKTKLNPNGFTLIELLVVVAIIAILAAIAVPNLLEAQTRSKVSRCRADQRSLATALEAYRVDHHAYPPDVSGLPGASINGIIHEPWFSTLIRVFVPLTTPVGYIATIPQDVFHHTQVKTFSGELRTADNPTGWGFNYTNWDQPDLYNTTQYWLSPEQQAWLTDHHASWDGHSLTHEGARVTWCIYSQGPSLGLNQESVYRGMNWWPVSGAYDPTNGTISYGEVGRIGP